MKEKETKKGKGTYQVLRFVFAFIFGGGGGVKDTGGLKTRDETRFEPLFVVVDVDGGGIWHV